jgi:hypothetical protein
MRLTINLPEDVADGLLELAHRDQRYPKQQATWIIMQVVRAALGEPTPSPVEEDDDDGTV